MKRVLGITTFVVCLIILIYQCTKVEEIYTCGDRNGDGIENELDCIGRDGKDGVDGKDGLSAMPYDILMMKEPSTVCDGYVMSFYADINGTGQIESDVDRLIGQIPVCNGEDGQDGADGADGTDGTDGVDGVSPTFQLTNTPASETCPYGGVLVEIFVNDIKQGEFEVCNGADGEDFVYNHSYSITNNPPSCTDGGKLIKIFDKDNILVEQVELCYGMTFGALQNLVIPLRKYFEDVTIVYKEIECNGGVGFEVWVSIDSAEILHFFICPPAATDSTTTG